MALVEIVRLDFWEDGTFTAGMPVPFHTEESARHHAKVALEQIEHNGEHSAIYLTVDGRSRFLSAGDPFPSQR